MSPVIAGFAHLPRCRFNLMANAFTRRLRGYMPCSGVRAASVLDDAQSSSFWQRSIKQ